MPQRGIVTVTSDLGLKDPYLAMFKGELLKVERDIHIIDITHEIRKHDVEQAGFVLHQTIPFFPTQTVHISICDVNSERNDKVLIAAVYGQWLVCSDNGLLNYVDEYPTEVYISEAPPKRTSFHAFEWFIPAVSRLLGGMHPSEWLTLTKNFERSLKLRPSLNEKSVRVNVIYIDGFENVMFNITNEEFELQRKGRRIRIILGRDVLEEELCAGYEEVKEGEPVILFNSAGYLELAINKGKAASLLNLKLRDSLTIEFI